ncbi:hypothetical protein SRHO_G00270150 [Serrasalmus rhombeus]
MQKGGRPEVKKRSDAARGREETLYDDGRKKKEYALFFTTSATGILNHSELHKTTPCSHMTREKEEIP